MTIQSITIEGMHNVDKQTYAINKGLTYFYGKNGAGKTTILQAIQLALLGYIPGVNKNNQSIFKHSNSHTLAVTAKVDNDGQIITIRRIWSKLKSNVTSTVQIDPENYNIQDIISDIELPIFNFNEFINMSSNSLKDWFISFLPNESSDIDWNKILTESAPTLTKLDPEIIAYFVSKANEFGSGLECVRNMHNTFKTFMSAKKQELNRINNTVQSLVFNDDVDNSLDSEEIKHKLESLQNVKSDYEHSLARYNMYINSLHNYETALKGNETLDEDIDCLIHKLDEINTNYESFNLECSQLYSLRSVISNDISNNDRIISGKGLCQYSGNVCDKIVEMIDSLKDTSNKLRSEQSDIDSKILALKSNMKSCNEERTELSRKLDELKYKKQIINNAKLNVKEPVARPEQIDIDSIVSEITKLNDTLIKLIANERYNNLIDSLTADIAKLECTIDALDKWIKLTGPNGLQMSFMFKPFEDFTDKLSECVRMYFNDDNISTKFVLSDKSNSFEFGLIKHDEYIPFSVLSSGEKCLFTIAMMTCIVNNSNSNLKVILIDDMLDHLDDDNMHYLFNSIENTNSDFQFIFAGVKPVDSAKIINIDKEIS